MLRLFWPKCIMVIIIWITQVQYFDEIAQYIYLFIF